MTFKIFEEIIVRKTEALLTFRKRRALRKKAKQNRLPPVLDWVISIFVIIIFVMLINMFLFQNYRIPSESMVPELLVGDLIFVEKVSFGPELLPGVLKLTARRTPQRGEVVSFESDVYALEGPLPELFYRFVYFITLSSVNLRTDANNNVLKDLLIKRVIGLEGDRVREFEGRFEILPVCEDEWQPEKLLVMENGTMYTLNVGGYARGVPFYRRTLADLTDRMRNLAGRGGYANNVNFERDNFERDPTDSAYASAWHKSELGHYVPSGMFFPMGDNRIYSRDARSFGPVSLTRIQGKALFRFFPFSRFGSIQ